jgi:Fur family transcriptional regulator, ferric uptake regulator
MTKYRLEVLDILLSSGEPLSAADLLERMVGADQVTVYRTLHYLEDHGYADSFILHCASHGTKRYYTAVRAASGEEREHRHWFHCERCHRFTDLGCCKMEKLVREYESENGIQVTSHTLYLTGICAGCR